MNYANPTPRTASAPLEGGGRAEVDQLIWFASSSVHDLCAALADPAKVPAITAIQLDDLKTLVVQAQRAHMLGRRALKGET